MVRRGGSRNGRARRNRRKRRGMKPFHHAVRQAERKYRDVFFLIGHCRLAICRIAADVPGAVSRFGNEEPVRFGLRHNGMLAPDSVAGGIRVVAAATIGGAGSRRNEFVVLRIVGTGIVGNPVTDRLAHERILAVHVLRIGPRCEICAVAHFHNVVEHTALVPVHDAWRRHLPIAFRLLFFLLLRDL